MGRRSPMCTGLILVLLLGLPFAGLVGVSAESSGGINASSSSIGLVPNDPVMGGSMEIRLTLENSNSIIATDVEYRFYKDGINSESKFVENTVNIAAGATVEVSATWMSLNEGDHKIWVEIEYGGDSPASFYKSFTVSGLANLEIASHSISPESGIREGDTIEVSVEVENSGSVSAPASELFLGIEGLLDLDQFHSLDVINSSESTWVNTTLIAPVGGDHVIVIMPDVNDDVVESVEGEEIRETLTVDPEPDFMHADATLSVSTPSDSIRGDWEISGILTRKHTSGASDVQLGFSFPDHLADGGDSIGIPPITISMVGDDDIVNQSWNLNLTWTAQLQNLGEGTHRLQVRIDPFGLLTQALTSNDYANASIEIRPEPNVYVDQFANPSSTSVEAGGVVNWRVSILNTGDIPVSGGLEVVWEGQTTFYNIGTIDAGISYIWNEDLLTSSSGEHQADFTATWIADNESFDANSADSVATGSVMATTSLNMQFSTSTAILVTSNGLNSSPPLDPGTYTYSIQLTSSGLGETTLVCEDITAGLTTLLNTVDVNITERGTKVDISCTFETGERSAVILNIRSLDSSVISKPHQPGFNVDLAQGDGFEEGVNSTGTILLFGFSALILIGILIAAVILTRRRFEEVERDIFDYCPACEGEIEGDEDKCPYCEFNLKRARRKFHNCASCEENIPSLLENCPYCGAVQDIRTQFKARERKQVVELPVEEEVEEEEEVDEEAIVAGTEDFDEMAGEFGFDEAGLESEWDEKLEEAETEIDEMLERQAAELELLEPTPEDEEEDGPVAAIPNISTPDLQMSGVDIDELLGDKKERRHLVDSGDDGELLDASDAGIRSDLFDITGESGVLPGQDVIIGMGVQDHRFAGNELPEEAMDFSFVDDELTPAVEKRKRIAARRKKEDEKTEQPAEVGECGACGADIETAAKECPTCGARFA
ncbi:MAG: CARDB domain-containing protein [Candidatus Poseidoniaceae archaeon]|nr:CARDB domain-containing protein [Candidatus Poseidoniaceae archaeon]